MFLKQTSMLRTMKLMIVKNKHQYWRQAIKVKNKQIIECLKQTSMLRTMKLMIVKNKHQYWRQANQWLLKIDISV